MKKKILIVTSPLLVGGFDIIATSLQMNLDKKKFECTYYLDGEYVGPLEQMVKDDGAQVIHRPDNIKSYAAKYRHLKKIMDEGKYDAVHSHLMFYSGLVMRAAAKSGIEVRIPHSHMTNPCFEGRSLPKRMAARVYGIFMKRWLNKYGTTLIACGPEAGEYLYGKKGFEKKGYLLNNAVNLDKFRYSTEQRNDVRKEFDIEDKLIIGHVGRLNYVKNHSYLIDVFYEIQKIRPKSVLMIVGDGDKKNEIEAKIEKLGIKDKVILTGLRNDIEALMSAMDVFVFPSLYEGLPVTLIEAQAVKLPCLISDTVSRYSKQNDNVEFISLQKDARIWAEKSIELSEKDRESTDITTLEKNYNIKFIIKKLEDIYLKKD